MLSFSIVATETVFSKKPKNKNKKKKPQKQNKTKKQQQLTLMFFIHYGSNSKQKIFTYAIHMYLPTTRVPQHGLLKPFLLLWFSC